MHIVALDVGTKRIGVAHADTSVRIAIPAGTIVVSGEEFNEIAKIMRQYKTDWVILGLPRNSKGMETAQSAYVRDFARKLQRRLPTARIRFQDESLTSVEAEKRLRARKGSHFAKGEIDAEAATIILQDFIETYTSAAQVEASPSDEPNIDLADKNDGSDLLPAAEKAVKTPKNAKSSKISKKLLIIIGAIVAVFVISFGGAVFWYKNSLSSISDTSCAEKPDSEDCKGISFSVKEGESISEIAENLHSAGLVRNSLATQLFYRLNHGKDPLRAGLYEINRTMSTPDIIEQLIKGENKSNVFSLTILPGETVKEIKEKLVKEYGYSETEVDTAFAKEYDHPVLEGRRDTSNYGAEPLEGYIYGDTYEFYKGESVENIIKRTLDALQDVVEGNNLSEKFALQGLSLYQGITLASIVQKEAKASDQADVAQVFLHRISDTIPLGSDVTTQYALDLVDPNRETYGNNADALRVDSLYNTRLYAGLPPGPISNPGSSALVAVANPSGTDALYFLTGDDGKMYYSKTEEEHNKNARDHCSELCKVSL